MAGISQRPDGRHGGLVSGCGFFAGRGAWRLIPRGIPRGSRAWKPLKARDFLGNWDNKLCNHELGYLPRNLFAQLSGIELPIKPHHTSKYHLNPMNYSVMEADASLHSLDLPRRKIFRILDGFWGSVFSPIFCLPKRRPSSIYRYIHYIHCTISRWWFESLKYPPVI